MGTKNSSSIYASSNLKGRRILITAGPTWIPLDGVRVIGNIATGETGRLLAKALSGKGARVTILHGPAAGKAPDMGEVSVIRFTYFDELRRLLRRRISSGKYDAVIHAAAVSDYEPCGVARAKIPSDKKELVLRLKPAPKLIDGIKKLDPRILLVGFKYEPSQTAARPLISKARALMRRCAADIVVANTGARGRYAAYIVGLNSAQGPFRSKRSMARQLSVHIGERL